MTIRMIHPERTDRREEGDQVKKYDVERVCEWHDNAGRISKGSDAPGKLTFAVLSID